jgi:hypothetical protein
MTFAELIKGILREHPQGLTPQQIREIIKREHPTYYGTEAHQRNVEKGHYKDLEHALLAQIYVTARSGGQFYVDKSFKPFVMSLVPGAAQEVNLPDEEIETESLEKLEAGIGRLYVLGTSLYTKAGEEIVKIGITTGTVENRISQLYTTGVPFRFRVMKDIETKNYYELEQSLHKLLDPYRINKSREFFTEKCLLFVDKVVAIHNEIHSGL